MCITHARRASGSWYKRTWVCTAVRYTSTRARDFSTFHPPLRALTNQRTNDLTECNRRINRCTCRLHYPDRHPRRSKGDGYGAGPLDVLPGDRGPGRGDAVPEGPTSTREPHRQVRLCLMLLLRKRLRFCRMEEPALDNGGRVLLESGAGLVGGSSEAS